jgi:hypothetical protein
MRACNGCRKRKIRCDAATTNAWPCSACTRLRLVCVPPTIGQNGDFLAPGQSNETSVPLETSKQLDLSRHTVPAAQSHVVGDSHPTGSIGSFNNGVGIYSQYISQSHPSVYSELPPPQIAVSQQPFHQQNIFPSAPPPALASVDNGVFIDQDKSTAESLSEVLGELKIDETGIGEMAC